MKSYDMSLMTKKIYDSSLQLFPLKTLQELLEIDKNSSFFKVTSRLVESGVLTKIERNKYIIKNYSGSEFFLANFIYEPSYVSFESALSYYGILSQFPHEITSATIKQTQSKEFNGKQYCYYRVKKELYWGYIKQDHYLIADKEKALADQMYLSSKGIKSIHFEEYNLSNIDKNKLKSYILKYPRTSQFKSSVTTLSRYLRI